MGIFAKLFERRTETPDEVAQPVECPHTVLIPRWERAEDMGDESKAVTYLCESCGAAFDPMEAAAHRAAAAGRLKRLTASREEEAKATSETSPNR